MVINRVTVIILDSVGAGELPDAELFGDVGANTLGNISRAVKISLPNMEKMGLGNILPMDNVRPQTKPIAAFGKMAEVSKGKDTTTGHWEIAGVILDKPLRTYPNGFPAEVMNLFEEKIGRKTLGNVVASGTEIIKQLGPEHMASGFPIVYTSVDSVFQIAAHEDIVSIDELYKYCQIAREILVGNHKVGRVIARPFIGQPGNFQRTSNRRDFSMKPPQKTLLDMLKEKGLDVIAVGKIEDIFSGQGITEAVHTKNNIDGINKTIKYLQADSRGLIFTNLVEFDSTFGHRNDIFGYANALEEFDQRLPEIISCIKDDQLLVITADHGCDPTTKGTDHTREYVPLLIFGPRVNSGKDLGILPSFSDLGATIADIFDLQLPVGRSFRKHLLKEEQNDGIIN